MTFLTTMFQFILVHIEKQVFLAVKKGRWSLTTWSVQVAASGGSISNYPPVTMLCPCRG